MGPVASLCSGDIFKELQEKYGEQFVKLMVAEKSKEIVNEEFGKVTTQTNEVFQGFNTKTNSLVDEKTNVLNNLFEDMKAKVNNTVPGGIGAFERLKGGSINDISGFSSIIQQVTSVKSQALNKIEGEKLTVMGEVNNKKVGMFNQIDQQRPRIAMYDDLPDPLKSVVRSQAEETFADQIGKNKGAIVESITKQFNVNNLQGIFQKISPEGTLNNIVSGAAGQLSSALGLGGLGGGIGSMLGGGGIPFFGR